MVNTAGAVHLTVGGAAEPRDLEAVEHRRMQQRVARLAAAAALLAALIGIGAATVGSITAASSAQRQAKEDFLRAQRIQVYSEFLAKFYEVESGFASRSILNGQTYPPVDEAALDALSERRTEFAILLERVYLITDTDASLAAEQLDEAVRDGAILTNNTYCHDNPEIDLPRCIGVESDPTGDIAALNDWARLGQETAAALEAFRDAARAELGLSASALEPAG
jgi:hypothetical protein